MKKLFVALSLTALVSFTASAQTTIFSDNFDGYADQAALNAAWNVGLSGGGATLTNEQAFSLSLSLRQGTVAQASGHDITPVWGTDAQPLVWSFQFYDSTQAGNLRQYATIRDNSPALAQLVAFGAYNDTTLTQNRYLGASVSAADLNTYYAVRVAFAPGPNWFILNGPGAPTRTTGWHELKAVFTDTKVEFFVDGVNGLSGLDTFYAASAGAISFDRVTVGSGLSSANGVAFYDDVLVQLVPEPSGLALAGLGAAALLIFRRRQ